MQISQADWEALVDDITEQIMKGDRKDRLSPLFDAPQFAREFIDLASRVEARDLHIRAYTMQKDRGGKPIRHPKTGKPKFGWVQL